MAIFDKKFQKQSNAIFAAIDIGSSKICCAIAKKQDKIQEETGTHFKLIGFGQQASKGIRYTGITDLEQLEDSILNSVHTAEQLAETTINNVVINVPSNLVKIYKISNQLNVSGRPVDDQHLRRLLNITKGGAIPADQQILHVLPFHYKLDSTTGILDPRGMIGDTLEGTMHVLTTSINTIRNLSACLGRCHLDVEGFVAGGYAAALSTLDDEEKLLGVTLIDIGGGATTITSFIDNRLVDMTTFPLGGIHITNDIARVLATPISQAERLKNLYGTLLQVSQDEREMIVIPQLGEHGFSAHTNNVSKFYLSEIIRCRVEEIFGFINKYIKSSGVDPLVYQRVIITGGSSQLSGMREFASDILSSQVRIGFPQNITEDMVHSPLFSVCAGLLEFFLLEENKFFTKKETYFQKITSWFKDNV